MNYLDITIIVLFFVVLFFNFKDTVKEKYTNWSSFSQASPILANTGNTAVNLWRSKPRNYGNFGIIGKFPAIPICDNCGLDFGCSNYAYPVDDKNKNICRKCNQTGIFKNYNQMDKKLRVFARSVGRPRQCRNIMANDGKCRCISAAGKYNCGKTSGCGCCS